MAETYIEVGLFFRTILSPRTPLHRRVLTPLLIVAVALAAVGCTTMKTVRPSTSPSHQVFGNVKAGDTVALHLTDGTRLEVTVARVERDALVSAEGVRYEHGQIVQLQKRSFSVMKTIGFVAAAYLATVAAIGIAFAVLWNT